MPRACNSYTRSNGVSSNQRNYTPSICLPPCWGPSPTKCPLLSSEPSIVSSGPLYPLGAASLLSGHHSCDSCSEALTLTEISAEYDSSYGNHVLIKQPWRPERLQAKSNAPPVVKVQALCWAMVEIFLTHPCPASLKSHHTSRCLLCLLIVPPCLGTVKKKNGNANLCPYGVNNLAGELDCACQPRQMSVLFKNLSNHTVLLSNLSFSTDQFYVLVQVPKFFWDSFLSSVTPG